MSKPKKFINLLIKSLLIFGALVVIMMIIAPQLINLVMVRDNIENTVSKKIGGEISYRRLDLSYFPRPHVVVHKVEILIPDSFTIKMHRMKLYPKILPLFWGSLKIDIVTLEYANYFMRLPQIRHESAQPEQVASFNDIADAISTAIRGLPEFKLPELKLRVENGKIDLIDPLGRKFNLSEVQANYQRHPDKLDFSIRCKSNLWDQIDVNGFLNPLNFKGKGKIRLSRFRPEALMAYLFHDSALKVTDTKASLTIDVELDGTGNLEAVVDGAAPLVALSRGQEQLIIKGGRIQGKIQIGDKTIGISLTEMGLDYPRLEANGMFSFDENRQDIQLAINGSRIDAAAVRQVAIGLLGESKIIRKIFDIIRGGYVPWMTVRIRGRSIAELGMPDNIVIKGRMTQGKIFIPGAELNLEDVIGDAQISEGILHGQNLEAQMGNSGGQNGKMTLGLNKNLAPFHLSIGVNADLSQLPTVLGRVVRNKKFLNELALVKDVKGTATGMLMLGDDLASLNAKVQASNIHLTARYMRLPYALAIGGGHFSYGGTRLAFDNFNATMEKSSVRRIAGDVSWAKTPVFSARSGRAIFHLEDIGPLIFSHKNTPTALDRMKPISGSLAFERMAVSGPVLQPSLGQVSFSADVEQLVLDSKRLPGSLRVDEGKFSWRKNRFTLKEIDASLGNSKIARLSAGFDLGKASALDIHAQSVALVADEVYPLLLSFKNIETFLKDFSVTKGMVFLPDLKLKGPLHLPAQWRYALTCSLKNLVLTSDAFGDPVTLNNGSFDLTSDTMSEAARHRVRVNTTDLTWGENRLTLIGGMILSENETMLDLTLTADAIDYNQVKNIVGYAEKKSNLADSRLNKRDLLGTLKVRADNFNYQTYSVNPLIADLSFKPDKVVISVNEAVVCNISFQGRLKVNKQTLEIFLVPTAVNQMLAPAVACITDQKHLAMGTFNLKGQIRSKSKPDEFLRSLSGEVAFSAEKGRIYRFGLLAKILSILNVTEIYRGEIPDLIGEGFAYHGMTISADIKGGKLIMQECSIDGVSMGIACEGNIDLAEKKMDFIILVAPFKTVDRIVKVIPLIGHILGGKLISIPFRAKGNLADPDVIPLHPKAVGSEVLGILERTLKLPITVMQPIFSSGKNHRTDQKTDQNPKPSGPP